jgi:nucleotide-binding universal stress UspA family protein
MQYPWLENRMPMIKKILFPVDFSDSCLGAARYVEALAGRFEAEIMLLHVVGMGEHNLAEDLLPQRQARLDAFLADELKYFTTQRLCVTGDDPETEIIGAAQYWGPDLVTMPTHGLGAFRRLLLGSITAKVLHDLECPVWTGVHSEAAPPLEDIHCRRILCAMDLTEHSHRVLQWAARLAGECQASLGIVHATAELPTEFYSVKLAEDLARSVTEHTEQEKRQIQILQTAAGTAGQVFIKSGDPAKVVACAARNFDADLLVIGRHGETGIAGYLRQSAYSILRDSPCPVISI